MNIKVAAFTVSEKSINTGKLLVSSSLMSHKDYYGSPEASSIMRVLAERSLIGTYLYS